jgi:hypothetical protein
MPCLEDVKRLIAGLGTNDGRGDTTVTGLIPALSSPRPNPPSAELVRLYKTTLPSHCFAGLPPGST